MKVSATILLQIPSYFFKLMVEKLWLFPLSLVEIRDYFFFSSFFSSVFSSVLFSG